MGANGSTTHVPSAAAFRASPSRYVLFMEEYRLVKLNQLESAFGYWKEWQENAVLSRKEKELMTLAIFSDVLGNLMQDSDIHFVDFSLPMLGSEEKQRRCFTREVFLVLALLSSPSDSSIVAKVRFAMKMHLQLRGLGERIGSEDIKTLVTLTLSGFNRLFNIKLPPKDVVDNFVTVSVASFFQRITGSLAITADNTSSASRPGTASATSEDKEAQLINSLMASSGGGRTDMNFDEFWQYCQDTKEVSFFLDRVRNLQITAIQTARAIPATSSPTSTRSAAMGSPGTIGLEGEGVGGEEKTLEHLDFLQRRRNPLWHYRILDMINDQWFKDIPNITSEDNVFAALEHTILSARFALPVFYREPAKDIGVELGGSSSKAALGASSSRAALGASTSRSTLGPSSSRATLGPSSSRATLGPSSSRATLSKSASKASAGMASRANFGGRGGLGKGTSAASRSTLAGAASKANLGGSSSRASFMNGSGSRGNLSSASRGLLGSSSSIKGLGRGNSRSALNLLQQQQQQQQQQTQSIIETKHELFGMIDVTTILAWMAETCPDMVKNREEEERKAKELEAMILGASKTSSSVSAGKMTRDRVGGAGANQMQEQWLEAGSNMAQSPVRYAIESKYLSHRPIYSNANILQVDNFVYNVFEMFAQGYRAVPIAASAQRPWKTTHVITGLDLVNFLRYHGDEVLGRRMMTEVGLTNLMRKPLIIPSKTNYGSAIVMLAERDTEVGLILDEKGKVGAILRSDTAVHFWLSWWRQTHHLDAERTLEDLQDTYERGHFKIYDGFSTKGFTSFSTLLTPISMCEQFGVNMQVFDEVMEESEDEEEEYMEESGEKKSQDEGEDEDEEIDAEADGESDSSSSSSSSSENDSDDGGQSKSSAKKRKGKGGAKGKKGQKNGKGKQGAKESPAKKEGGGSPGKGKGVADKKAGGKATTAGGGAAKGKEKKSAPSSPASPKKTATPQPATPSAASAAAEATTTATLSLENGALLSPEPHVPAPPGAYFGDSLVVPNSPDGDGGTGGVLGTEKSKKASKKAAAAAAKEAKIAALAKAKADEEERRRLAVFAAKEAAYRAKMDKWNRQHDAIQPTDTIRQALDMMFEQKTTKLFVVSQLGEAIGVISLMEICRDLLKEEASSYLLTEENYRKNIRKNDFVVRPHTE